MISSLSVTKKRILKNIFSLSILQGGNYILPLITIPYLLRVIGIDYFGLLAFANAIVVYFLIFSDYGFNLSATNHIAVNKENRSRVNDIFCSVLLIKLTIASIGFLILLLMTYLIPKLSFHREIYLYTYGLVFGQVLIPLWLFQGMEKMKYMTIFNLLAKVTATVSIFIFIKTTEDFFLVPILTASGYMLAGIISLYCSIKEFGLSFYLPSKKMLEDQILDGWYVFISRVVVTLYSTTNTVVLGFLTSNNIVGYYNLAEKIIGAISGLFAPVTQAVYPYMSNLYKENKIKFARIFKTITCSYVFIASILACCLYFFRDYIIFLIAGSKNNSVSELCAILCIYLIICPLGSLFTQTFIIKNRMNFFIRILQLTFLTNILLVFPMIYYYKAIGLAYTVILVQMVHNILNLKYYLRSCSDDL